MYVSSLVGEEDTAIANGVKVSVVVVVLEERRAGSRPVSNEGTVLRCDAGSKSSLSA